ncbi:MAG: T9SS type A sorting domain-containing protein [Crocinitomicaceae bacterium]|nr:T9SS type A sorting domain-containing protein [Crocinitomicaceae bacterium]
MKKVLLVALTCYFGTSVMAQNYERCRTPQAIQYQENLTPGYMQDVNNVFNEAKSYIPKKSFQPIYTIPVVVHVVYNIAAANLPDSVIIDQIRVLNEDYNRMNADTVNMRSDFDIVKGSPQIQFVLAQIDEFGNPTTGITRTQTSTTSFGSIALISGDFSDLEKVKSTANGGHDPWDQTRYLNIWVCDMSVFGITALLGYATPPSNLPNWPPGSNPGLEDGVVIQYQAFGSNNPNTLDVGNGAIDVRGRTCTHEVGHYLGLRHIWGDGDCNEQDGIDDTPNADDQSNQDCDFNKNTCTDNILGVDLPDMVENYMDYSEETCQNSFTQGQVDLMHGVLENQRYDLVHNNIASIDELDETLFTLSPNPANALIKISAKNSIKQVEIVSLTGATVFNKEFFEANSSNQTVDVSKLENGIYILNIQTDNVLASKRIVIQK